MATILVTTILFAIFSNSHAIWCYVGETKDNSTTINPWDSPANFCYRMTSKSRDYIYYMFDDGICEKVGCWLDNDGDEWCCCNTDLCNYNFTMPTTTILPPPSTKPHTQKPLTLTTDVSPIYKSTLSPTIVSTHPSLSSSTAPSTTLSIAQPVFDSHFFFLQGGFMILYNIATCNI